jgi:lipid A 3-O-deacylase
MASWQMPSSLPPHPELVEGRGVKLQQRAAALLVLATLLAAAPAAAADRGWSGTVLDDDDFWAPQDHDEYYTHGIRLSVTSGDVAAPLWLAPFNWLAQWTPAFPDAVGVSRRYNLIPLGQNMYTPRNPLLVDPDPRDRPYAGWLYGGIGLMQDTPGDTAAAPDQFDELALKLGIVGPGSLAHATQTRYHLLIHVTPFQGWHAQIRDEPAVDLFYQHKWRDHAENAQGWGWDAIPQWDLRLGTVYDYAGLGGMLRFGRNLRVDYGPPHIDLNTGADYVNPTRSTSGGWTVYGFVGSELRAVGHNIFLDGNDFKASAHVTKIPAVGDLEAGLAFAYGHYRFAYTYVVRSPEFAHQVGLDHYGALDLSVHLPF